MTQSQQATEIRINGTLYDVKGFRHPGGSILKFFSGSGDATEAFNEFHCRSEKAQKLLKTLPNRPAPPLTDDKKLQARLDKMTTDFANLRKQLVKDGWFEPSPIHYTYRTLEIVVMHIVGIYLLLNTSLVIPALAILGIASGRCGWLMHEAGHYSFTGNIPLDVKIQETLYGIGCGMSGAWWRNQHNKHHATPQKLKHDVDLDTLPFVAFNEAIGIKAAKHPLMKAYIKVQNYTFAPVTCLLVALGWQFFLHPRHMIRTKRHYEIAMLGIRFLGIYLIGCAYGASLGVTVAGYMLYNLFGSCYIFGNFALSHTHLDVVPADNNNVHWLEYAGKYTIDITPSYLCNWWMGYLNFQIEHHLFPSMPQFRFTRLHPKIRKLFEENGIKYDVRDYFAAVRDTWGNLESVAHALK